ncbi:MAG: Rrf2 family transcriptional regulator [candidate division KSB1 bacterium]|nr:Rrf2 family transcriptional regulator [candidate division KSB1 bacterium]MDZ7336800.1 Rrf2 family transcriptional regulator [candidate division KSB1 bacterium]MDZ7358962.1 Rrf2 family transcriptional regulator [candidate division KSB1 bacterium]MDZ7376352.1 Rrf2 family transcriptional regulator [candidate division KSB1 bacterium]MDZ7402326.1 Rrf2 family transcriptional regulator [candidate division KSB1 bacterium]
MQLSRAGEYAVRAMLHLAAVDKQRVTTIAEIANTWNIPESFLRKILLQLARAGLINSSRGMGGGLVLSQPADQITLFDVIEAVEGKTYFNQCLIGPEFCENRSWCPVHVVWRKAQNAFSEILRSKTLADLVANSEFKKHFKIENQLKV